MSEKLRVAFVTPEFAPYARSGQLADFSAVLPRRLVGLGVDVSLIVPKYRTLEGELLQAEPVPQPLSVPMDGDRVKAGVFAAEDAGLKIFLVDHARYFLRDRIYGPAGAGYLDNDERFVFFSRAVTELLLVFDPPVDIVHCHDWPTALVPVFLKTHYRDAPALKRAGTLLTLHTSADQGEFPPESLAWTGLNWDFFSRGQLTLNGKFNFLKAGIVYSDLVNATNPAHERALRSEEHGHGLDGILRRRGDAFTCVQSGTDPGSWDEAAKGYIRLYEKAMEFKRGGEFG
jgi:starch synthase